MERRSEQRSAYQVTDVDAGSIEFLSRMAGLVPGIIYVFNHASMSNEYSNRSIAELLGYFPDEVVQMGDAFLPTVMHPEDLGRLGPHFAALQGLAMGEHVAFEYRVTAKDGREVWLRSIDSVFDRAPDGSIFHHIGIALDITAQKHAEAQLLEANAALEDRVRARTAALKVLNDELEHRVRQRTEEMQKINRDLEQLTYVATHDLKVPINNMTSLIHMLEEAVGLLPDEHVETLGWMREVCQQASEKLDALICVAQAHSGAMAPFHQVHLAEIAERVQRNLQFQIEEAQARITTRFCDASVFFLPLEMETILQSLVGNALKYRKEGQVPEISIRSTDCGDHVHVSVQDNGSGLDLPRDEAKVFGLFQRVHSTPQGAGVALYAIRRLMERVGGEITVQSMPGVGSTFTVRLPRARQAVPA